MADVFLVTFPLLDHPGQTYSVILDRDEAREGSEDDAKHEVICEIEQCDDEEAGDYPDDLDMDADHVVCRRMTEEEAEEASKSSINTSHWG
jgi:hypothetical protein